MSAHQPPDTTAAACAAETSSAVPADLGTFSTRDLLAAFSAIMRELRRRDIVRTSNNPAADIAEQVVAEHYRGTRESAEHPGCDVIGQDGERIQVKALRVTAGAKRRNLSAIRSSDYDSVVIVLFDEDFRVVEGLRLSRETVEERFRHNDHVNGRIITVTQKLRADDRVERLKLSDAFLDDGPRKG